MRDEQVSRTMARLLRHKAAQEGLPMRPDGYVRVTDLLYKLSVNRLHSVDFPTLERIVARDNKGRYKLICEPDGASGGEPIWWIRANQGHSLPDVKIDMIRVTELSQITMAVHGTTRAAWEKIALQGLSRMGRQHIHFAQGVPASGVMSGMRATSQVYIYLDISMAIKADFNILLSSNGVVLCPGDENGFIGPEFFSHVEWASSGEKIKTWIRPEPILKATLQEVHFEEQPDIEPPLTHTSGYP
ncbi:KptA family-domain-containing protein [Hysterangium stoloniferum]|nr:KptA family-domain-containing protein [Hysterangium stoloniferum]